MKKFLLLLSAVTVLTSCNNPTKVKTEEMAAMNTDLLQQNLKGNPKTITESSTTIDSTGGEKQDTLKNYLSFNQKGYQTSSMTKNNAGELTTEQFVSQNDAGIVTEFGTRKNGKVTFRVVTELDKDGKYIGGKSYDSTGQQDGYYKELAQNEYGIVYAGKHYKMNNKIMEIWSMKYDKNHFLGGKSTDSTGKTTYEGTAKVNDKGDMSEEDFTTLENGKSKSEKKTYEYNLYDSKGNWTRRTVYNDKGKRIQVVNRSISYYN